MRKIINIIIILILALLPECSWASNESFKFNTHHCLAPSSDYDNKEDLFTLCVKNIYPLKNSVVSFNTEDKESISALIDLIMRKLRVYSSEEKNTIHAFREILRHAIENSFGHGRGYPITVCGYKQGNELIIIIENISMARSDKRAPLDERMNNSLFTMDSEPITIPNELHDMEGGRSAQGLPTIIQTLNNLSYIDTRGRSYSVKWKQKKHGDEWIVTFSLMVRNCYMIRDRKQIVAFADCV